MQKFTSAKTSINSTKLPAIYKKANLSAKLVFDYGCGKYTDHIDAFIRSDRRVYLPYDPYNQPDDVNKLSVTYVINAMHVHYPVDVVCSNVLNVIDSEAEISRICHHIEEIVTTTGGTGYVTVYEGNRSCIGKQTGKDQYQRNAPLQDYIRFFHNATIKNGMIVVER